MDCWLEKINSEKKEIGIQVYYLSFIPVTPHALEYVHEVSFWNIDSMYLFPRD